MDHHTILLAINLKLVNREIRSYLSGRVDEDVPIRKLPFTLVGVVHATIRDPPTCWRIDHKLHGIRLRSEEHTSELQSQSNLVCRLLLEKKKKIHISIPPGYDS